MSQEKNEQAPIDLRAYHPLARLRWYIRGYVFLEGLLMALICACLWFWFTFTLDFSLQYFFGVDLLDEARWVRIALAVGFGAVLVFFLVWYIVRRIFREFRSSALALVLEKRFPELLGDRLITAVELVNLNKAATYGYSIDMIKKTMLDARERVDQVPIRQVFSWKRLALTAWTLVGVSVIALLLAFPVALLFSLFDVRKGPDLWRMLVINLLVVIGLVLVFLAPFTINWCRRSSPAVRHCMIGLGTVALIGTGVGYVYAMDDAKHYTQNEYWWRFYHGTDIAMSRDLKFSDERWPKDDYFVEWLDFPVEEKRIVANKPIMARGYFCRFIIAGEKPGEWRPMLWSDLKNDKLALTDVPALPLEPIHNWLLAQTMGDVESPVGFDEKEAKAKNPTANDIKVDFVFAAVFDEEAGYFDEKERKPFKQLEAQLQQRAADLKLGGRLIRYINPPDELKLSYREVKSKTDKTSEARILQQPLKKLDGRSAVYSLETKAKFTKEMRLWVEGTVNKKTIRSDDRFVGIIQPPRIELLEYQEFRPAYYYHLPPVGPRSDTFDERRALLKDKFQQMGVVRQAQPPETVDIKIFNGSAVQVTARTDKPLKEVEAYYSEPAPDGGKATALRVPLRINSDGRSFDLSFSPTGRPIENLSSRWWAARMPVQPSWALRPDADDYRPIIATIPKVMPIELKMVDTDNMDSTRYVAIVPSVDGLPNVTLFVSTIRKIEEAATRRTYYLCTAKAEIPFAKESYVVDDHGIHKVDFTYEYLPLSNSSDTIFRAGLASWLWASTPVMPSLADFVFRREVLIRTVGSAKRPDPIQGVAPIDAFATEQRRADQDRPPITIAKLEELLKKPLSDQGVSPILKRFDFWNKAEDKPITFDINQRLPDLQKKDPLTGEQTSYELILDVRATDSNVQSPGRVGTFKDGALIFRIVTQEELFRFIAREEREQADKLDDIIKKLDAQYKVLQQMASRLPTALTPETAVSEQTRIESILDTITKQREAVTSITDTYARLIEEYKTNRFEQRFTAGLNEKIRDPLIKTQTEEFPASEVSLNTLNVSLKDGMPGIAIPAVGDAILKLNALIEKLRFVRGNMGETFDFKQILLNLQNIITGQHFMAAEYERIQKEYFEKLLFHKIINPPNTVNVAAGGKATVKLEIRMAQQITITPPNLKLAATDNKGFKVPDTVSLAQLNAGERSAVEFDVTAGDEPGTYELKVTPSQTLEPLLIKVVVK